jgi:hypothetical protein
LAVSPDHYAVKVTGKHPDSVDYRFPPAELQFAGAQENGMTAQLVHAGFKGHPGACGTFAEDHSEDLALEKKGFDAFFKLSLQIGGKFENLREFFGLKVPQS